MKPFFVTIAYNLNLTILPETEVRLDGHPVLTYTYSIFRREVSKLGIAPNEIDVLPLKNKEVNPYYLGRIDYEEPGTVFNYIADGEDALTRKEVEEVIEEINRYRDTPELWEI